MELQMDWRGKEQKRGRPVGKMLELSRR